MLKSITMINKLVDIIDNIYCIYANIKYINKNTEYVRNLHIDGPSNFDYSITLRNM